MWTTNTCTRFNKGKLWVPYSAGVYIRRDNRRLACTNNTHTHVEHFVLAQCPEIGIL